MQPIPRPFFLSFERVLQDRIPRADLMQAMDEAMWEFVSMHLRDPAGRLKRPGSAVRIGSIAIAFYRLMTRSGFPEDAAIAEISQACRLFEGALQPAFNPVACPVAQYFSAKDEPDLCEAAFCGRCLRKEEGCGSLERLKARSAQEAESLLAI